MENEKRFSLLNNPWIKVVMKDGTEKEVSLLEIFPLASDILMLGGELETQNAAVLRLLLAIMYASFITNSGSDYQRFKVSYEAVDLWESIWKDKKLPTDLITSYLNDQEDNFWLIHPTKPFMQSPIAKNGTEYKASKLFGDLSESSNKQRLFQSKSGESKERCSFAEAARWLLYLNAYDDTSAKPKAKGLDSPGAGWLGQLGQIYVRGNDLFETLMLNFCLLKDGEKLWPEGKPYWELNKPAQERERIEFPKSPVEMLTLRSRWLLLQFNGDDVIGFTLLGGNHFNKEYPLTEQYTVWRPVRKSSKKDSPVIGYKPRRHNSDRQIWRDFANFAPVSLETNSPEYWTPGIVAWIQKLLEEDALDKNQILSLTTCSVQYGDKDFFVNDLTGDSFSIHTGLLSKMSSQWRSRVFEEIRTCEKVAYASGIMAEEIALASGASGDDVLENANSKGREIAYELINEPFRVWIRRITPENTIIDEKVFDEWHQKAKTIGNQIIQRQESFSPDDAIFGRTLVIKDQEKHYSLIEASDRFLRTLNSYYPKLGETK